MCIRRVTLVFNNEYELHSCCNYHILGAGIYFCESSTCLRYKLKNSGLCKKKFFLDMHHILENRPYMCYLGMRDCMLYKLALPIDELFSK